MDLSAINPVLLIASLMVERCQKMILVCNDPESYYACSSAILCDYNQEGEIVCSVEPGDQD